MDRRKKSRPIRVGSPPLPGDGDLRDLLGFDVLADISLQKLVGHPEAALWIEVLLREEKAVFAAEVADGPRGLGHEVEAGQRILLAHRGVLSFQG